MRLGSAIGYVHAVADKECDWKEALLIFARGFGACIMQRDDPLSELPKLTKVSDYYVNALNEAQRELDEWLSLSQEDRIKKLSYEVAQEILSCEKSIADDKCANAYLKRIADGISSWNPPTDVHRMLKSDSLKWLADSKQSSSYMQGRIEELKNTDLHSMAIARNGELCKNLNQARESLREEQERVDDRNSWIKALYESLGLESLLEDQQ